ncbi:MAG: serine hydrolase [Phycisphaerae bacterium]|jgi:CubicO group peptidase (beta-lactamase class C family)
MRSPGLSLCCLLATLQAAGCGRTGLGADSAGRIADVDRIFAEWDKPDSPGCALAIVRNGGVIYQRGYGMANLEHGVPITPATLFHVASVSKQFTALAVLMLAAEGRLSLEDEVRTFVPEMAGLSRPVRIRHLMHHTSGMRDQWELLQYAGWRNEDVVLQDDVLKLIFRQRDLNFEPGERFGYCNSSYTLMGLIVERVSGQTLPEFCRRRIFEPLGMKNTHIRSDFHAILPNRAYSYDPRPGGGFQIAVMSMALPGPTALQTTVEDLARWDRNFEDPVVGGPAVMAEMLRVGRFNDGRLQDYAGGLRIGTYRGLRTVSHTGVDAGYRAVFLRFPDQRFTVIVLANLGGMVPAALARKVADLYLDDRMEPLKSPAPAQADAASASPADLKRYDHYAGSYWLVEDFLARTFVKEKDRLMLKLGEARQVLREVSPGDFVEDGSGTHYLFPAAPEGPVREMKRQLGGEAPTPARRIEAADVPAAKLSEYVGHFRSPELEAIYTLHVQDGRLLLKHRKDEQPLIPMRDDEFLTHFDAVNRDYGDYVAVRFLRDAQGGVSGLTLGSDRVRNLRFERVEIR